MQTQECSDAAFCKGPVYIRLYLAFICIVINQTDLLLQLCNANIVRLQCARRQQRGHIPGAQTWFYTFSNSFPADYFQNPTKWRDHGWDLTLLAAGVIFLTSAAGLDWHTGSWACLELHCILLLSCSWASGSCYLAQDANRDCAYWREVNLCVQLCLQIMSEVHV